MLICGNFAELIYPGLSDVVSGKEPSEPKEDPKAVAKAKAERDANPEEYDRLTKGMIPHIGV